MITTAKDDSTEEFKWRAFASSVWVMILLPFAVCGYLLSLKLSSWSLCRDDFFSFSTLLSCISLQIISLLATYTHKRIISVHTRPVKKNVLLEMLHPNQFVTIIYFVICSMTTTFTFVPLDDKRLFLKSNMLSSLIIPYSAFLGVVYGVQVYTNNEYQLKFPVIQQKRLFQIKKTVQPAARESISLTLKAMKSFVPIYLAASILPRVLLSLLTEFSFSVSFIMSDLLKICDLSMIWSWFLTSVLTCFLLLISNKLLHVFYMQHYNFPLETALVGDEGKSLSDAMSNVNPILKHLAYLDYCTISKTSIRRPKMFELSLPGNQPHLWNKTSLQCLQQLEKQRLALTNECERKELGKRLQQAQVNGPKNIDSQDLFSPIKDITMTSGQRFTTRQQQLQQQPQQNHTITAGYLFENLQIVIWSIEGICNLVAASLHEDSYGVVQKNLPSILTELLALLEACEQFAKTSVAQHAVVNNLKELEISQQEMVDVSSLKIALKSGIYTITSTFRQHTTSLRLSGEHKKRIMAFLEYDE